MDILDESMVDDIERFFDKWNAIGVIGLTTIGLVAVYSGGFSTQSILVMVTAVYAFISFNQMREARWRRRADNHLAVRPSFQPQTTSKASDFGLKNFGESPALNLRIRVVVEEDGEGLASVDISAKSKHLHLDTGGFIPIFTEVDGELRTAGSGEIEPSLFRQCEDKTMKLYYTYESNNGMQYPRSLSGPINMRMDNIVEKTQAPREVQLSELKEKLSLDTSVDS